MFDPRVQQRRASLERVRALEAQASVVRAEQLHELARYARLCEADPEQGVQTVAGRFGPCVDSVASDAAGRFADEELAAWMTWTTYRAEHAMEAAARLTRCLPLTFAVLQAGLIDEPRAMVVVRAVRVLDDHAARVVDEALAPVVAGLTTSQLEKAAQREVQRADEKAAERRHRRGCAERHVSARSVGDGLARLTAVGPAVDVLAARDQLRAAAREQRSTPGEERPAAAIEFDLLVGVGASAGSAPAPATVNVTVALTSLAGLDDDPAHLDGIGPVPVSVARELATRTGSRLRRLVTDPVTGTLLGADSHTHPALLPEDLAPSCPVADAGGGRYRPPAWMDRHVKARQPRCSVPWCEQPSGRCDVDHLVVHPEGPTCPCNLHPLCRRHHRMKQSAGWGRTHGRRDDGLDDTDRCGGLVGATSGTGPAPEPATPRRLPLVATGSRRVAARVARGPLAAGRRPGGPARRLGRRHPLVRRRLRVHACPASGRR